MSDLESPEVTENKERRQYATGEVVGKPDWLSGSSFKPSGVLLSDRFDIGQTQDRSEFPDKVEPRWFGHSLSLPPHMGMRSGTTKLAEDLGVARYLTSLNGDGGPAVRYLLASTLRQSRDRNIHVDVCRGVGPWVG